MNVVDPRVEAYAESRTTPPDPALRELDARTREQLGHGAMLSGPVVDRLLGALVALTRAAGVLEVGTFSGASALAMAEELGPEARIVTLEADPARAAFARDAIAASPHGERVELIEGPALDTIAGLDGPFDVVFIDADKAEYRAYVEAVLPKLAPHGVMALDNTLLGGAVLDNDSERGRAMDELNVWLAGHPDLTTVLLTVRDGVTLVRRRRGD